MPILRYVEMTDIDNILVKNYTTRAINLPARKVYRGPVLVVGYPCSHLGTFLHPNLISFLAPNVRFYFHDRSDFSIFATKIPVGSCLKCCRLKPGNERFPVGSHSCLSE